MTDKEAEMMAFLAGRLEHVHGEDTNLDYLSAARRMVTQSQTARDKPMCDDKSSPSPSRPSPTFEPELNESIPSKSSFGSPTLYDLRSPYLNSPSELRVDITPTVAYVVIPIRCGEDMVVIKTINLEKMEMQDMILGEDAAKKLRAALDLVL